MFISNTSFHLWSKENLVKHQRVSKYYENNCRLWLAEIWDLNYFEYAEFNGVVRLYLF